VIWWVVVAIVGLALVGLAAVAVPPLSRVTELRRLQSRIRRGAEPGQARLAEPLAELHRRVESLQERLARTQARAAAGRHAQPREPVSTGRHAR
jgi:hypothetical protein